ncbi:hypothetical protein [Streptomyces bicolor]|uniref:hypothetical protein n=1 Tax=Streptomyces bicolor TaxID=66874 RepID=UPI0004E12664|nr:hypothetical protein [Streptomyces bicolor]
MPDPADEETGERPTHGYEEGRAPALRRLPISVIPPSAQSVMFWTSMPFYRAVTAWAAWCANRLLTGSRARPGQ